MYKSLFPALLVTLLTGSAFANYSNTVMSLAPLGYWQLNETAAAPADTATNGGTLGAAGNGYYLSGAVHPVAGALAAGVGQAVNFPDAAGNRVSVPYRPALAAAAPFSVEFWANPNAFASTDSTLMTAASMTQFGNPPGAGDGTRKGWLFYQNAGAGWIFRIYGAANAAFNAQANVPLTVGTWCHVVGIYDGTNTMIYVNGQLSASTPASSYVPVDVNASPLSVGARGYGALGYFRYNGSIDEMAYYTNVLSATEVMAHYQNGTNPAPASSYATLVQAKSPAVYLRFDEPAYTQPDPSTYPVAVNKGSLGIEADGYYQPGAAPGAAGVSYSGVSTPNYATGFGPERGGWVDVGISDALNFTGPFTISTWFKTAPTDARFQSFIGKGDSSWRAGIDGDGKARFAFGSNPDATGTANLNDGKWHQLVGVYDGANLSLYIDGLLDATQPAADFVAGNSSAALIGTVPDYGNDRIFKGSMDEVAVFGSALTAEQIQQLYFSANVPPQITQQPPSALSASEGSSLTITAVGMGSPTLAYQWTKNGTNLVGRTATNLVFSNLQIGDSGNYALVVTNNYGAITSSVAVLTVQAGPPIVLASPQPVSRYLGMNAAFSVRAGGSAPLYYQWLFNGANLPSQTTTNLLLSNLQQAQAGNYSCRITNAQGAVTSSVAALTIIPAPTSSYAQAVLVDAPMAYWRLGEANGGTAFDYVGGLNGYYTNVTLGQSGYSFSDTNKAAKFGPAAPSLVGGIAGVDFATNSSGVTSFSLEAWVKATPQSSDASIITKGTGAGGEQFNLDFGAGGNYRFFVRNTAGGALLCNSAIAPDGSWKHIVAVCDGGAGLLQLYIDGTLIAQTGVSGGIKTSPQPMTISARQSGTTAFDLQMDGVIDDVAVYNYALDGGKVSVHYNARYAAGSMPVIGVQPASTTNYVSLAAAFGVEAGSPEPPSYQWQMNANDIPSANLATLMLSPLEVANAGNYRVIVANSFGAVTSSVATLTVLQPPTALNLSADLVLHLPFDGNLNDTSGRNNHGTNVGATTIMTGKVGSGALHYFTDTSISSFNYVTLGQRPDLSFSSNVNFTVAYWIKLPPGYFGGDLPIFCNAAGSAFSPGYTFAPSYNQGGWSWTLNGTGVYGAQSSINDGNWYHLTHTFDRAGNGITYLNGIQVDSRSVASVGSIDQVARTCIGQDPNGTYGESGEADVDDLGVWRRVLTPLEVGSIYMGAVSNGVSFATTPVLLSIQPVGNQLRLSWNGSGALQAAGEATGTYTNVPGALSPYLTSPTGTKRFFRVQLQ